MTVIIICGAALAAAVGVAVIIRFRPLWFFGVLSSMRKAEKRLLREAEYSPDEIEKIQTAGEESANYTNVLYIVNARCTIGENEDFGVVDFDGTHEVAGCMYEPLSRLMSDVKKKFGMDLLLTSTYRTHDEQEKIYASNPYAVPAGTSEHETGLAADMKFDGYAHGRFLWTRAGRWVNRHAHEYGFIMRYPFWGKRSTGISYEPWHIRYVGAPHAELITRAKVTLEEYAGLFEDGKYYVFEGHLISRQTGELVFPQGSDDVTVSPDNNGGYFIWGKWK